MTNYSGRKFSGIWIPASLWLTEGLSPSLKILLVEIDSLDNGERGCFASNSYFANFLKVSESQASRLINTLVDKGLIRSELISSKGRNNERRLYVNVPIDQAFNEDITEKILANGGIRKNAEAHRQNCGEGIGNNADTLTQNCGEGIRKNAQENKPVNKPANKPIKYMADRLNFDEAFDLFWKAYPNKKSGKTKAKEGLVKLLKKTDLFEVVMNSIEVHKKTRSWIEGYVPHATTWLNQARYEAEFSEKDFAIQHSQQQQNSANRIGDNSELDALLSGAKAAGAKTIAGVTGDVGVMRV
ncbi:helix-turn-helix domain-containing protein [Acinetobacter proteolyticus]|uniref:Helix-turn-helix domain-containing protein n=1 Tax=Acinetobacter proteolyticus TaxID=1776741 RepID=A0A2N0WIA0_9GAMM|nr:helix-turn-helix domain-containing protein [Acinetobacter proteolyticus]PKF35527.1 hypothetical protein CW311_04355 [Acinetobacter proteolyticus]